MITFLPYPDFIETARCLDRARLGKQRVESALILRALGIEGVLINPPKPKNKMSWNNHPAIKMWIGYEECLKYYYNKICEEWISRGYRQNMKFFNIDSKNFIYPHWLGNEEFHASHRAALLYKDYEWYKQFNWKEEPKISYIWPSNYRGGILKGINILPILS